MLPQNFNSTWPLLKRARLQLRRELTWAHRIFTSGAKAGYCFQQLAGRLKASSTRSLFFPVAFEVAPFQRTLVRWPGMLAALVFTSLCGHCFALDRSAFTFTSYKLEVRVDPSGQAISARGTIILRNDSAVPQANASLQISSSLDWRLIEAGGKPVTYVSEDYTTDIDHTGQVREAILALPAPVPPRGTVELDVGYSGTIAVDTTRLTRTGLPDAIARRTDWDQISENFTAVRGVGHVVWYPVAMEAANFSQGDLFPALAQWKEREALASMEAHICWITDSENRLTVAANGALQGMGGASPEANTGCSDFRFAGLGQTVPTFVIGNFEVLSRPAITIYHLKEHQAAAQEYALAAEKALPFVTEWFGKQREKAQVIELNDEAASAFDSGPSLFMPLRVPATAQGALDRKTLELALVHQLVHSCFYSPRPWINEGLAYFGQALYKEQQDGRAAALAYMKASLPPLVEVEKLAMSPGGTPQPLPRAFDDIYYRTKAMYVWWMLRDMLGDEAIQKALASYRPDQDNEPSYVQRLIQAGTKRDLEWFFDDWVYRDRGLPDFKVDSAYPRALLRGNYVVTLTVENLGAAGAEVPVIARAENGSIAKRAEVRAQGKAVVRIEIGAVPREVVVNDGSVPESDFSNNTFSVARPK